MNFIGNFRLQNAIDTPLTINSRHTLECGGHNPDPKMALPRPIMPGMARMEGRFVDHLQNLWV